MVTLRLVRRIFRGGDPLSADRLELVVTGPYIPSPGDYVTINGEKTAVDSVEYRFDQCPSGERTFYIGQRVPIVLLQAVNARLITDLQIKGWVLVAESA